MKNTRQPPLSITRHLVGPCLAVGLFATAICAEETHLIAAVSINCKSAKNASTEEEQAAIGAVKVAILEKHIASVSPQRKTLLAGKKDQMLAAPDAFVDNFLVRDRQFDKKTRVLALSAEADVNVSKISALVDERTAPATAPAGDRLQIVGIFVARRQAKVESHGPLVTTGTRKLENKEAETAAASGTVSVATKNSEAVSSVSSVIRVADQIDYELEDNFKADVNRTISKVFVDRGFDLASASDLVDASNGSFNPDVLQKDFEKSSEFSLQNQRVAKRVCREAGAAILAFGTLTIYAKRNDPSNARNTLVTVSVDAQAVDCRKPLTVTVGSVGGLQVEGVGADETEAARNAVNNAADKVANTLADQLRNRGIR